MEIEKERTTGKKGRKEDPANFPEEELTYKDKEKELYKKRRNIRERKQTAKIAEQS